MLIEVVFGCNYLLYIESTFTCNQLLFEAAKFIIAWSAGHFMFQACFIRRTIVEFNLDEFN